MEYMLEKYGKWAVITGASSGIGKAFAYDVAAMKMNVILVSNEKEHLDSICADISQKMGVSAISCCVDLSDTNSYEIVKTVAKDKEVGLLINDASYGIHGKFEECKLNDYNNLINVNINAYVALTHIFLPEMVSRKKGAVIMVSSLNAFSPIADSAVYTATKAFEMYFGGALWQETKGNNVDVLVVMPGPTRTGFQERAGTKVNVMAMTPEDLVKGAWPCLGKKMVYIPGLYNKLISFIGSNIDMEKRVVLASKIYKLMLHEKPDADLFQLLAELDFL
jgi:short-subunit dehydrogenase